MHFVDGYRKAGLPERRAGVISQTAIRSESCRLHDRVIPLADLKVLQRITDSLRDWLDEWKAKEPNA